MSTETARSSIEFGRWVRRQREKLHRDQRGQKVVAKAAEISQGSLSQLERQGVIPKGLNLEKLCSALHASIVEARALLDSAESDGVEQARRELSFRQLKKKILRPGLDRHIFIIREDAQPVDRFSIDQIGEMLNRSDPKVSFVILFVSPSPDVWQSFRALRREIALRNIPSDAGEGALNERLKAYYLHIENEDRAGIGQRLLGPPLFHPYALVVDSEGATELWLYHTDAERYYDQMSKGISAIDARNQSLSILKCFQWQADALHGWIGFDSLFEPASKRWKGIDEKNSNDTDSKVHERD